VRRARWRWFGRAVRWVMVAVPSRPHKDSLRLILIYPTSGSPYNTLVYYLLLHCRFYGVYRNIPRQRGFWGYSLLYYLEVLE